jgi:hypothetical protein
VSGGVAADESKKRSFLDDFIGAFGQSLNGVLGIESMQEIIVATITDLERAIQEDQATIATVLSV